jgi:hypothetical protein
VPQDRESLLLAQAWLAWRELWRTDASLVRAGHAARGEERWLLGKAIAECCGEAVTEGDLDAGYALLEGLLIAVCAPVAPLPRDDAVALLERLLSGGRAA